MTESRDRRLRLFLATLLMIVPAAACDDGVSPESVTATGYWKLEFALLPSDFTLDLHEGDSGGITGNWSFPGLFANNPLHGTRQGLEVKISATSPNIFPALLEVEFKAADRLEGTFYFGGTTERIILKRTEPPPFSP